MHSSGTTGTPNSRVRIVVALQKYYKGLYRDLSDRYLGVKNSNSGAPRAARSPITKKMWQFTHPRKFDNHVTVHRASDRPHHRHTNVKKTQSTGMATQMQLKVLFGRK